jgi:hypothetical protein
MKCLVYILIVIKNVSEISLLGTLEGTDLLSASDLIIKVKVRS